MRYLRERAITVAEVNQPHAHSAGGSARATRSDAEIAARLFLAGKAKAIPKQTNGIVEAIRLLRVARHGPVKSRTAALIQVRDLIITAPQELRDQLSGRDTLRGKATVCARFRPSLSELRSPSQAAKFALRSLAQWMQSLDREITALEREITALDRELAQLVATAAPLTIQPLGISTGHASQLLVAGQNIDRLHGESSFAMLCGASPIPASRSGAQRLPATSTVVRALRGIPSSSATAINRATCFSPTRTPRPSRSSRAHAERHRSPRAGVDLLICLIC